MMFSAAKGADVCTVAVAAGRRVSVPFIADLTAIRADPLLLGIADEKWFLICAIAREVSTGAAEDAEEGICILSGTKGTTVLILCMASVRKAVVAR